MTSQPMPAVGATVSVPQVRAKAVAGVRFAFIDNLRILLVILVILHHLAVTYSVEGAWYYYDGPADAITTMVLTLFVAINEAFFMGFYFLIAAYFVPRSLERRGLKPFFRERFLRLGVPLAFQLLVVGPLLSYGRGITIWGYEGSFWTYIGDYWRKYQVLDVGPVWFVEALLIFSTVYALGWRLARPPARTVTTGRGTPGNLAIGLFALGVGLITFIVRIWLPVGWSFAPLGFQFPHFPQYIGLFLLGTVAYRRGWLSAISEDRPRGRLWGGVVALLIALAPVLFVAGGALQEGTAAFRGGFHWQSLAYALWEQFLCVALVIGLLVWFRRRHDRQGTVAHELSSSAYAVYLYHAPILVFLCIGLSSLELPSILKVGLAALICVPVCFLVGGLVRRLPGARRIL